MSTDTSYELLIPLRRLPLWSPALTWLSAVTVAFAINTAVDVVPEVVAGRELDGEHMLALWAMALWLGASALGIGIRAWAARRPLLPLRLGPSSIRLPKSAYAWGTHEVPYGTILAVGEGGRLAQRIYFIESRRRVYHLPHLLFAEETGPQKLFAGLKQRLHDQPGGTALLKQTEHRRLQTWRAMATRPIVTHALLGIGGVFFLNTWLKGALDAPFGLLRWGANAPAMVYRGELYRLLAANFLHGQWLHATMNGLALWYLGSLMERLLGWARFSILYLSTGALAMAASAYGANAVLSVGASGAIFGLLGGFASVSVWLRERLPLGVRQTPRWWMTMLGVNTLLPLLWPVVDITAHVAGFVAGAALTFALLVPKRRLPPPAGRALTALAIAIMLVYGAALATAVKRAADTTAQGELRFGQLLLADTHTPAKTLNTLAWLWVIDPGSTEAHLLAAKASSEEAVRREPQVPEYLATLATVCQRLRDAPCRIDAWRRATQMGIAAPGPGYGDGTGVVVRADGGMPALYAAQLAHVLAAAPSAPEAPGKKLPPSPYRLQQRGQVWHLQLRAAELITDPATVPSGQDAKRLYLLGRGANAQPATLVALAYTASEPLPWALPNELCTALHDAGVRDLEVAYEAPPWPQGPPWVLWRLPEPNRLEGDAAP